jgi:enamine deaminase RidA (YjgF/YER057c/UK114 family)
MKIVQSEKMPAANGHYSQCIEHNGFLFLSGQLPIEPLTKKIPDGIAEQTQLMLRKLGADAVGMSTVPEYKLAKILGMEIIAASLITNSAKEVIQSVSHDEVIEVANNSVDNLRKFIEAAILV